ncbi:hypothetical protein CBR_g1190 [Chara braunii]|uniref:Uncharacterized protein n=1 Tax=Chara braunii TaxID=69332 RepID=A0A388KDF0_CHABU|nr:hypothetical protein CBR_g1190 [Chara braunii]|eukprot:GBG68069.1 hypothetical protein CBR_g1190 [Chara braunii]
MGCVSTAPPSSTRYGSHETSSESRSRGPPGQANRQSKPGDFKDRELEKLLAHGKELPESVAELHLRVLEPSHEDSLNLQGRRRTELIKPAQQSTTGAINSRETALQRILRKRRKCVSAPPSSTRGGRRAMSSTALSRSREHRAQGGKISSAVSMRGKHWARMKLTESEENDILRLAESKELPESIARRFLRVLQTSVRLNEREVEHILILAQNKGLPQSIVALFLRVLETLASDSVQFRTGRRGSSGVGFTYKAIQETATEGGEPHARVLQSTSYNGPFGFVDRDVLTFRGNLLFPSSQSNYPDGNIYVVQPSSVDESIYFLSYDGVWSLPTGSSSYGVGAVRRVYGSVGDDRAFTIVDMDRYLYRGEGRFLLVANARDDTLRTFSLNSYDPPFPITHMMGFNSHVLSLAADPSRPYVYFSTDHGLYKMYLPSSGVGTVVPLIDEASAVGPVQASIPGDAGFNEVRVSQHAFSADGQFMYVADKIGDAVYRVWFASGRVENIGSGYVDVDVDGPYGLALTSDGCNLFVSEYITGRITLISFERSGGLVKSVRTLAGASSYRYTYSSSLDLFGLAISPGGSYLYVGAYEAIYKFEIDTWDLPSCSAISSTPRSVPPTIRPIISSISPPPVISVPQRSGNIFPPGDDEPTFPSRSTTTPTRNSTPPLPPDAPSPISFSYPPPSTSTPPPPFISNSSSAAISSSSPPAAKKQTDLTPVVIALAVVLPVVGAALGVLLVWCLCGIQRRRREAESRAIDRPVQSIGTIDARAGSQQIEPVAFTNNPTGAGNWWQGPAGEGTLANNRLDAIAA